MPTYHIKIQSTIEGENPRECAFEDVTLENFEFRFDALMADIQNIPSVTSSTRNDHVIIVSTDLDIASIKDELKPFFARNFCHIRFVEIVEMPE